MIFIKIKILILGGMSYKSTINYYREINEYITNSFGNNNLELIIYQVNFSKIVELMKKDDWKEIGNYFETIIKKFDNFLIEKIILASNTIHNVINYLSEDIKNKIINITDSIIEECNRKNHKKIGYLGTSYLLEKEYLDLKFKNANLELYKEDKNYYEEVDNIIFNELCKGAIKEDSKRKIIKIINEMKQKYKLDCIILGCTELGLLGLSDCIDIEVIDSEETHLKYIKKFGRKKYEQ